MVKKQKEDITASITSKDLMENPEEANKINASTVYETCTEHLSPFGGLLALIKFKDLTKFEEVFNDTYIKPKRKPKLGNYRMVSGVLMLLFIGFNRLWHFSYIRKDSIICGFLKVTCLPVASTFWRYVDSLGINQAKSFLDMTGVLRERAWKLCNLGFRKIHVDIDTTVETLYGDQEGGRKGHNTKNRGKKGYRPVLAFIYETREYIAGKLRKGETMSGEETASLIAQIKKYLPGCVRQVLVRADGEFMSWDSVSESIKVGFEFIIANRGCDPPFDPDKWYRSKKKEAIEYNSCVYTPMGWKVPCRFVAMRIPEEKVAQPGKQVQLELFSNVTYKYRIFVTSLKSKAHKVITIYDKRADVENLVGEAKREGLAAIPSAKFKTNYAFFQLVMLAYNIWRYLKLIAKSSIHQDDAETTDCAPEALQRIDTNTIRIARLKLLFIAAKVVSGSNTNKVRYSIHDSRTSGLMSFLNFLDTMRSKARPWKEKKGWSCRFLLNGL
ncbi:MAG: IS1380 family transposase [Desulfobacterales bacterium]|nr:IS1380 family transposase [Desulfobacterales bacterium]